MKPSQGVRLKIYILIINHNKMKYLIAVKLKDEREVQIYEFEDKHSRMEFSEQLRHFNNVEDISYSQIERVEDD
mgnify:CR=1 FL=1